MRVDHIEFGLFSHVIKYFHVRADFIFPLSDFFLDDFQHSKNSHESICKVFAPL